MSLLAKSMFSQIAAARSSKVCNYLSKQNVYKSFLSKRYSTIDNIEEMYPPQTKYEADGLYKTVKEKLGLTIHGYPRHILARSGVELYDNIATHLETEVFNFIEACKLPDTLYSWYLVHELHVWMMSIRLMAEDAPGKVVRKQLVASMWQDVTRRAKDLGKSSTSAQKNQIRQLGFEFYFAFWSYDESLHGDDKILAAFLWEKFLGDSPDKSDTLECLVHYVRKNIYILDNLPREAFLLEGGKSQISMTSLTKPKELRIRS